MRGDFNPNYKITPATTAALMEIEACRQAVSSLPITADVLNSLRESAKLEATHYSTQIEGNRLTQIQVNDVVKGHGNFPGRERDEKEAQGYYMALRWLEHRIESGATLTEQDIKTIHGLVMGGGRNNAAATDYRDGQNVIRNSATGEIVYMPPEAPDVSTLMKQLVDWVVNESKKRELPCPLVAGLAHYQFATIHPYYDGNGRTARLLTTLILHLGGYGLKGVYSLEAYYAQNLQAYYDALTLGPSHNYYFGRADADITPWVDYFTIGMADAFSKVKARAESAKSIGQPDHSGLLRHLDLRQQQALSLFKDQVYITSKQIAELFGLNERPARNLCKKWIDEGFFTIGSPSKKTRTYKLSRKFEDLI